MLCSANPQSDLEVKVDVVSLELHAEQVTRSLLDNVTSALGKNQGKYNVSVFLVRDFSENRIDIIPRLI